MTHGEKECHVPGALLPEHAWESLRPFRLHLSNCFWQGEVGRETQASIRLLFIYLSLIEDLKCLDAITALHSFEQKGHMLALWQCAVSLLGPKWIFYCLQTLSMDQARILRSVHSQGTCDFNHASNCRYQLPSPRKGVGMSETQIKQMEMKG